MVSSPHRAYHVFSKSLIALGKRPDILGYFLRRKSLLLIKNAQSIHDTSVEKHGVIRDTGLPVANDIPLKNLVAELRQRRPGRQADHVLPEP